MNTINGTIISANKRNFVSSESSAREKAKWVGAVDELESWGLIVAASHKRQIFTVTRKGYDAADKIERERQCRLDKAIEMTLFGK